MFSVLTPKQKNKTKKHNYVDNEYVTHFDHGDHLQNAHISKHHIFICQLHLYKARSNMKFKLEFLKSLESKKHFTDPSCPTL